MYLLHMYVHIHHSNGFKTEDGIYWGNKSFFFIFLQSLVCRACCGLFDITMLCLSVPKGWTNKNLPSLTTPCQGKGWIHRPPCTTQQSGVRGGDCGKIAMLHKTDKTNRQRVIRLFTVNTALKAWYIAAMLYLLMRLINLAICVCSVMLSTLH